MKIKRVKQSFRTAHKGGNRRGFREGELVPDSHPLVKRMPSMFEDIEDYMYRTWPDVEQATAAPGEKRAMPPKRRTAKKAEPKTKEEGQ